MVSPVVGAGVDFDSIRPQVADRDATPGDRMDYVIGGLDWALVAFDVAVDNFGDFGGVVLALESELEGSFAALSVQRRTALNLIGGAGTSVRERLRSAGRVIDPNFHEAKLLGNSPPPRTGSFLVDALEDTDAVLLENHTADLGGPWTKLTGGGLQFTSGRVRRFGAAGATHFSAAGTPATAEYDVETVIRIASNPANTSAAGGIGRRQSGADTNYEWFTQFASGTGSVQLRKRVAGVNTSLGSFAMTLTPGVDYTLIAEIRDATKKVFVDGTEQISTADNAITVAGVAGLFCYADSIGSGLAHHIASVSASDPVTEETGVVDAGTVAAGTEAREYIRTGVATTQAKASGSVLLPSTGTAKVQLEPLDTPVAGTQTLRIRARAASGTGVLRTALYDSDGTTVRGGPTDFTLTGAFQTFSLTPSGITDWSALQVWFEGRGTLTAEVSWVELQVPDSGIAAQEKTGTVVADTALAGDQVLTLNRSGTATADTLALAADAYEAVEAGAAVADTTATGADSVELPSAGDAAAGTKATGADVFEAVEIGTAVADTLAAGTATTGVGAVTYEKTGVAVTAAVATGADVYEAVETGTATADTTTTGADVFQATETGTATAATTATGTDVFEAVESGTVVSDTALEGDQVFTLNRSGTATADTTLAGVSEKVLAGKAGIATAGSVLKGTDVFEAVRAGVATSQAKVSGSDVFTATETGAVVTLTRLEGVKDFFYGGAPPPVTHTPTGGIYDQTTTNGTVHEVARSGTVTEYQRNGVVTTYSRGGVVVAKVRSGRVVEHPRGGTVREVVRSGSHDESPTGGEIL